MLSRGNYIITSYSLKRGKNFKAFQTQLLHETILFSKSFFFYFTTILKNLFEQFISFTTCNSEQKQVFHEEIWGKHPDLFRQLTMSTLKQNQNWNWTGQDLSFSLGYVNYPDEWPWRVTFCSGFYFPHL